MRILASRPVVIRESGRKWDRTKSVPSSCMVSWKARMIINISGFLPDSVDGLKIPCAIFAWLSRPQKHSTPSLPRKRSQEHGRHSFFREVHYITSTKRPRFCTSPTNSTLLWYTRPIHRINHFGRPSGETLWKLDLPPHHYPWLVKNKISNHDFNIVGLCHDFNIVGFCHEFGRFQDLILVWPVWCGVVSPRCLVFRPSFRVRENNFYCNIHSW